MTTTTPSGLVRVLESNRGAKCARCNGSQFGVTTMTVADVRAQRLLIRDDDGYAAAGDAAMAHIARQCLNCGVTRYERRRDVQDAIDRRQ